MKLILKLKHLLCDVILGCKFTTIGPIYYEYGSMVITFDNSDNAVQAFELLRVSHYEDKKMLGKFLFVHTVSTASYDHFVPA